MPCHFSDHLIQSSFGTHAGRYHFFRIKTGNHIALLHLLPTHHVKFEDSPWDVRRNCRFKSRAHRADYRFKIRHGFHHRSGQLHLDLRKSGGIGIGRFTLMASGEHHKKK